MKVDALIDKEIEAIGEAFADHPYERVELIDTTNGMFMSRREAVLMDLAGSTLLVGKK